MQNIVIDPITRIEGHLAIRVEVESGRVVKAFSSGEMFRGFEVLLKGRDPLDAQQITQRICGVCPISHGIASVLAQDAAYGVAPPTNGRLGRNLIQGANFIQSHIVHFYQLSALDFVDIAAVTGYNGSDPGLNGLKAWVQSQTASRELYPGAPFLPRYNGNYIQSTELNILAIKHYLEALEMRALAHKMAAVFGGKLPHSPALVPGGITEKASADKIAAYRSMLKQLRTFIDGCYLPDVVEVAKAFPEYLHEGKGCGNYLSYGVFPQSASDQGSKLFPAGVVMKGKAIPFDAGKITEEVGYSYYSSGSGLHPASGRTVADPEKKTAYSWIKAPRYDRTVMEVGPLARLIIAYMSGGNTQVKELVDRYAGVVGKRPDELDSVMGRHLTRAIECKIVADRMADWVEELNPAEPSFKDFSVPAKGTGAGLTEAPRGALGHWIDVVDSKIGNYQCVVPTTWNCSPRDDGGTPGPVEQSLEGTPIADAANPIEAARVVRSFDPCIACAVH